jgi:hypothetical protein
MIALVIVCFLTVIITHFYAPAMSVSSTNNTNYHNIIEILLTTHYSPPNSFCKGTLSSFVLIVNYMFTGNHNGDVVVSMLTLSAV